MKKVFVLDYELVSPIAIGVENLSKGILSNICAEKEIENFPAKGLPFSRAAEINTDLSKFYRGESELMHEVFAYDRKLELVAAAFGLAEERFLKYANLFDQTKTGVIMGVGADVPPLELFEDQLAKYIQKDCNPINELLIDINTNNSSLNLASNPYDVHSIYLAEKFNAGAFQKSILTACVSSTQALAFGYDAVARGDVEAVISGGTDSLINMLAMIWFGKLGLIAEHNGEPGCKPFDLNRKGAMVGESAGFAVLVSEAFLDKHSLTPKAEFLGYGNTLDAYKITAPDPNGDSITQAIKGALEMSGLENERIDYINAHGTGTRHNDELELNCIKRALGDQWNSVPISSTKDRHGHAIAAAGIQEFCITLEMMKHSILPGNLNLKAPCNKSFNLIRKNKASPIVHALTNNFAFGGINTVLAVKNMN